MPRYPQEFIKRFTQTIAVSIGSLGVGVNFCFPVHSLLHLMSGVVLGHWAGRWPGVCRSSASCDDACGNGELRLPRVHQPKVTHPSSAIA